MVTGTIRVRGGKFALQGMCLGDVVIESGDVHIHGMVRGSVFNRGGLVAISGTVVGNVISSTTRETVLLAQAAVKGFVRYEGIDTSASDRD